MNFFGSKTSCPIGDRNEILDWFAIFHRWDFITAKKSSGKPNWITIKQYPLSSETLYKRWANSEELVGVRFQTGKEGKTQYALLDVDIGSQYHPQNDLSAFDGLMSALASIGLCCHLKVRSSNSCGLHVYFPLSELVPCYRLAVALRNVLERSSFEVKAGHLEIFPNVKTPKSNYAAHRLPLQKDSYVLGEDFEPIHNSLERFIGSWYSAASNQNLELLKEAIADAPISRNFSSSNRAEWKQRLEETITTGWTSRHQTNDIVKEICIYGRVFLCKNWDDIEPWAIEILKRMPGFQKFCNHQHDINKRVRDWIKSNRISNRYSPYSNVFKASKQLKAPPNEVRSADALKRIEDAIAQIIERDGQLPQGTRARQELLCKVARCSASTLI